MSTTIDQRVVEMRFDNKQFESATSQSMSTIERLKRSLNFKDSGKSLESLNSAAKKVNFSGLSDGVESVRLKFSALEVMATTALANITNSAINAGKNLVNSLTLAPITSGFQEYETQMNAIQTIMANTQSKGSTLEDVKSALAELNTYADQTIYNFTEMTRNIGTFTAAGVGLEESVSAIKGIANLAAVSGSNAQQASTAMYQLSQALAAGRVSLMDWNSVVNAGMGGEVFQQALIRTARVMGTGVDAAIEKYGTFRESLTKGQWLTAEVLTETLSQISGAYTEADLIAQGYTQEQAEAITQLAETAIGAATDVKTFTQLWDSTQEAIGSGWAQTWQLIIGDFEEAKVFFSGIKDLLDPVVSYFSDSRNDLLAGALNSNWEKMISQINEAGVETADFNEELEKTVRGAVKNYDDLIERNGSLANAFKNGELSGNLIIETLNRMAGITGETGKATEDMSGKLEYFQKVVNEVWNGDYKNGEERIKALADAGYDYAQVQALVNKTVDGHKLTLEDLGDAQLKAVGYTDEEITALRELAKQAEATGTPLNDLINNLTKKSGREYLHEAITNLVSVVIQAGSAIGKAWQNIFPPMASSTLYNMIKGFSEFTASLANNTDAFDKIRRSFEGLFAILDLVTTILGGGFKIALSVIGKLLGNVNFSILDLTAMIGDAAVALRDFILDNELVNKGFELLATGISSAVNAIKGWVNAFLELPIVQSAIENLKNGLSNLKDVGLDAIEGLKQGLQNGITSIPEILMDIGQRILDAIKGVLGIHSPSTEMYEVGKNIIEGLINGIKDFASKLWDFLSGIGSGIIEVFSQIDWGNVFTALLAAGGIFALYKFASALSAITAPLEGLGDVFEGVGNVLDAFSGTIKSFNFKMKAEAIKTFAIAIAILAGSVAVLSLIPAGQLWNAVGVVAALSAVIAGLSIVIGKFGNGSIVDVAKISGLLLALSSSFLILAGVMKIISGMSWDDLTKATAGLMALGMIITGLVAATRIGGDEVSKAGGTILKIAVAMGALVLVGKLIAGMEWSELGKAGAGLVGLSAIVAALLAATRLAGNGIDKAGGTILKIAVAMGALVLVSKLIVGMEWSEMGKAAVGLVGLSAIVAALLAATRLAGNGIDKAGGTILKIAIAMGALVLVSKLIVGMKWSEMGKAAIGLVGLSAIVAGLILITNLAPEKDLARLGITLLMISTSIGILAGISVLLSMVKTENLIKGITAVGALSALMSMMIVATGFAKRSKGLMGNIIAITVAIGVMAAAVAGLSFIEPGRLVIATAAMSVLMGMFALIVKSAKNINGSLGPLIVMTAAIGVLAGALYLLSGLPIETNVANAAALSMLLLSLSASMTIASKAGKVSASSVVAIGAMTLALAGIAGVLILLDTFNVAPSIETAAALSTLLLSLSAACVILSAVGKIGAGAALQGAVALDGVIVVVGGLMAGIGALVTYFPQLEEFVNKGIGLLEAVGRGIGGFIGGIVGGVMSGITSGLPDMATDLSTFMTNLQPFIDGAKQIDESVLSSVGTLAGVILALTAADVVQGIASFFGLGGDLASFAQQLVPFGEAMADFGAVINGKLDPDSMEAAATAGNMLAALNSSLPRQGGALQNFLGTQDLGVFSDQLTKFGEAMVGFSQSVSGKIDQGSIEAAAAGGQALAELNKTLPRQGGALQEFLGSQDLGVFGDQLRKFGECIVSFSQTVTGKIDQAGVEAAAAAGQTLAELNKNLPKQDGWMQAIFGEQDLALFGTQLQQFGSAIVDFSATVSGKVNQDAVEAATAAGETLAALNEKLPKQNGFMQAIFGEQDMAVFGQQLISFGAAFATYSLLMALVNANVVTTTTNAAESLVTLANAVSEIETGGWFNSSTTLVDFGEQLKKFGTKFAEFYETISSIGVFTLTIVVSELESLAGLANTLSTIDMTGMSSFGKALTDMAKADIDGVVTTYQDAGSRIRSAVETMVNSATSGVQARANDVVSAFNTIVESTLTKLTSRNNDFRTSGQTFVTNLSTGIKNKQTDATNAFNELVTAILDKIKSSNSKFNDAGKTLVTQLVSGINSEKTSASTSFNDMITSMVSSIRGKYTQFYNAGGYLVQGFANGISANTYLASAKAQAMADAADTAARNALGVHSPSTVFYSVGEYVVQGFVNGISDNTNKVEDSGKTLGTSMLDATKDALDVESDTSELAKKVIGETFVNGIAEGIEEDMSAEEAAAKKAENIITAFSNALEKIDLSSNKLDLEQQLWDSVNENVTTDAQKDAAKLQTLLKEYEYQQQRIELAKAEYDTMVKEFGESSQDAKESYNKYLQEQIDLADLSNQIIELKDAELEREKDILDKRDEMIEHEYAIWKKQNEKTLTEHQEAIADLALLTQQYANQKQRVSAALSNYHAILSMFGADANETYEAYNEYLSQYEELSNMLADLNEAREKQLQADSSESYRKYKDWLERNKDLLLNQGFSLDEIYRRAINASATENYDLNSVIEKMNETVESAVSSASKIVGTNYMTTIEKTFGEEIAPTLTEQGENMAAAIGEGLQNGSEIIAESTKKLVEESTSKIETTTTVDTFANMGKSVASSFVSGIQSGLAEMNKEGSQLTVIGQTLASSFISSISMEEVSASLVTNLATGIQEQNETMTKAFEFLMALMVEVAKDSQNDFKEAGKYVVVGFANGISANTFLAQAQARAMANAAYQAAMEALDAHSPSKLFMQVGSYVPLGFAQGIRSAENAVTGSAASMADAAIQTTKDTISRIVDVINSDVDTQPTIRPVFDLSEVETGAKRLNAMFSRNQAMSISSSMTNRTPADEPVQNGDTTSGKGVSNTFIQNNYSPKALSRVEIYRQTKNQFSAFERVTKA